MPRRGSSRRKRRTHVAGGGSTAGDAVGAEKQPRSMVVRRGKVPAPLRVLVADIRTMLLPATAERLKERRRNTLRDYTAVAPTLGLSHLWLLSATEAGSYLKIAGVPVGPTATFRIDAYSLAKDVRSFQRRPVSLSPADVRSPPLLVLNNWAAAAAVDKKVALVAELFRHTVPPLDVRTVVLSDVRRVVLVDREDASGAIHLRQYALRVTRAGLSRAVRKMIVRGKVPHLAGMADISDLVNPSEAAAGMSAAAGVWSSDSEADDGAGGGGATAELPPLPQAVRGVRCGARSSVKLVEIGPRLRLSLVKVEAGVCGGEVLYHAHVVKSAAEAAATASRLVEREETRKRRREEQESNVARKAEVKRGKRERRQMAAAARAVGKEVATASEGEAPSSGDSGSDDGVEEDSGGEGGWVSDDSEEGESSDDGGGYAPDGGSDGGGGSGSD